jgi:hypothetical protein
MMSENLRSLEMTWCFFDGANATSNLGYNRRRMKEEDCRICAVFFTRASRDLKFRAAEFVHFVALGRDKDFG